MSIENFKATLWESALMENFHESSFVSLITTPPTDKKGNKVIFNRIQDGVWKQYQAGEKITWDQVATTKVEMQFDKQKYYAFMIEDCDQVQVVSDVLKAITQEQAELLAELIQGEVVQYIIEGIPTDKSIGAKATPQLVNKTNAYDTLVDLNTMANKKKVPVTERYYIVSPDFLALLQKDDRFTKNYEILTNGLISGVTIAGNQLICQAGNPSDSVVLTHSSGTGFAAQLDGSAEACRLADYFADGVRGLCQYGMKKLRDESSFVAFVKYN